MQILLVSCSVDSSPIIVLEDIQSAAGETFVLKLGDSACISFSSESIDSSGSATLNNDSVGVNFQSSSYSTTDQSFAQQIKFHSNNEQVATVDEFGRVTAIGIGETEIVVTMEGWQEETLETLIKIIVTP